MELTDVIEVDVAGLMNIYVYKMLTVYKGL